MNPNFTRSLATQTIIGLLSKAAEGEKISYATLNKAISGNVQGGQRPALVAARKALIREGFVFDTISNEGLIRLRPAEISLTTPRLVSKVRRAAGRHAVELGTADMGKMSADEQKRHATAMLHTTLIAASVNKDVSRRVAETGPENAKAGIMDMDFVRRVYGG